MKKCTQLMIRSAGRLSSLPRPADPRAARADADVNEANRCHLAGGNGRRRRDLFRSASASTRAIRPLGGAIRAVAHTSLREGEP